MGVSQEFILGPIRGSRVEQVIKAILVGIELSAILEMVGLRLNAGFWA